MVKKIVLEGKECQKKLLEGVEFIDRLVGNTIGPFGRNRVIQRKYKSPLFTNDGATIARHSYMDDEIADLGAQAIVDVAMKTAETAGDGTSASVVIAAAHVRKCYEKIVKDSGASDFEGKERVNVMDLWRQTQKEKDEALKLLKKSARKLKQGDLDDVISTSLENMEYGKTLGKLMSEVGMDGYISVEDNWATKYGISTELTTGMKFLGTYASPYLATSANKKEAVWEDSYVLVCNHKIEATSIFVELIKEFNEKGIRKLVIIGGFSEGTNPFSPQFIEAVSKGVIAAAQGNSNAIQILAVKASSLTTPELQDVSDFCGAIFFDKSLGMELSDARIETLGYAKKIIVSDDDVNVIGGRGNVAERVKVLKEQLEKERDQMFLEKLKRRIASLSSGVGIIRVGAATESERSYIKYKLEDAILSAKCALEEGIVKGGGLALKEVAEKMGKKALIYDALMAPYERIKSNAGRELEISEKVVDPLKVVRLSLENALSGAGMIITTDGAVSEKRQDMGDFLEKVIKKALPYDNRNDFRDNENQDQGAGRLID